MAQVQRKNSTFVAALCRAGEGKLAGAARFKRMAESASLEEAVSILKECGFGGGDNFSASEYQKIIAAEELAFAQFIKQNAPNAACEAYYLIPYDFRNAEGLVKSISLGLEPQKYSCAEGKFTVAQLTDYISSGKDCGLYAELKAAIDNALSEFKSGAPSGMRINAEFVKAKYASLARLAGGLFAKPVEREIIAADISACLRSDSEETAKLMLITAKIGNKTVGLTTEQVTALVEKNEAKVKKAFEGSEYKQVALKATAQSVSALPLTDLERESFGFEVSFLNDKKYSELSGEFIFSLYCSRRKNEIYCARLCLTAKANGVSSNEILKRLITV